MENHKETYKNDAIEVVNVGAFLGSDAYLILTREKTVLIDSGFSFCAELMIENIKEVLKDKPLDYCILTHSHYDHVSGSPYLKAHFPQVKIGASEYAAKILRKPSAIAVMREMNESAAKEYGVNKFKDELDKLTIDFTLAHGDVMDLGFETLKIINAPGHTKCSIALYMEEEDFLISCETMGVYSGDEMVSPCYLVGYAMSMDYVEKVAAMKPEKILVPHYKVLAGESCTKFIGNAVRCNRYLKELILEEHKKGKDYQGIYERYKKEFYNKDLRRIQPIKAFELNASYMIPMIIKECGESE